MMNGPGLDVVVAVTDHSLNTLLENGFDSAN
jgi:hypothetical protein